MFMKHVGDAVTSVFMLTVLLCVQADAQRGEVLQTQAPPPGGVKQTQRHEVGMLTSSFRSEPVCS